MVDVGCGVGAWLRASKSLGVDEVLGFDGDHIPGDLLEIEQTEFRAADLSKPLPHVGRRLDLAISVEVAKHLPPERAGGSSPTCAAWPTWCCSRLPFRIRASGPHQRTMAEPMDPAYCRPRLCVPRSMSSARCLDQPRG